MENYEHKISGRKVFYISGFDPRGARFYHNLYRQEYSGKNPLDETKTAIEKKKKITSYLTSWQISNIDENGHQTKTQYNFLVWDDIVRESWIKNRIILILQAIILYLFYFFSGAIFRLFSYCKGVVTVMLYPLIFILIGFVISYLCANLIYSYSENLSVSAITFFLILYVYSKLEKFLNVFWLLRIYIFCAKYDLFKNDNLDSRIRCFTDQIENTASSGDKQGEEILIVAHSIGAIILISVLYELLKKDKNIKLNILTLGQEVPLVSNLSWSKKYKEKLKFVASAPNLKWLDVSSPVDGACTPLVGPFKNVVEGASFDLKIVSPQFHKMFDKEKYKEIKKDKFRLHFQYLMSGDKPTKYDYFGITSSSESFDKVFEKF